MSISIHIPFYNPNPEKKEGYRNLTRFDYLKENILNLKKLSLPTDIFIHTHLIYTYNVGAEKTGITDLLQDLKDTGLKLRDLKTEQSNLEKIFVNLVRENNEI